MCDMRDTPDTESGKRLEALGIIKSLGYKWSNDVQVYYDPAYRMAPMAINQSVMLGNKILELIKNNQEEK